jgi:hypothetical protein
LPNTGLSIRPFVDHREPLCLVRAQRQNDPSSGFDLIEDRRRQSLGGGRQQGLARRRPPTASLSLREAGNQKVRVELIDRMGHFCELASLGYQFDRVAGLAMTWFHQTLQ